MGGAFFDVRKSFYFSTAKEPTELQRDFEKRRSFHRDDFLKCLESLVGGKQVEILPLGHSMQSSALCRCLQSKADDSVASLEKEGMFSHFFSIFNNSAVAGGDQG